MDQQTVHVFVALPWSHSTFYSCNCTRWLVVQPVQIGRIYDSLQKWHIGVHNCLWYCTGWLVTLCWCRLVESANTDTCNCTQWLVILKCRARVFSQTRRNGIIGISGFTTWKQKISNKILPPVRIELGQSVFHAYPTELTQHLLIW